MPFSAKWTQVLQRSSRCSSTSIWRSAIRGRTLLCALRPAPRKPAQNAASISHHGKASRARPTTSAKAGRSFAIPAAICGPRSRSTAQSATDSLSVRAAEILEMRAAFSPAPLYFCSVIMNCAIPVLSNIGGRRDQLTMLSARLSTYAGQKKHNRCVFFPPEQETRRPCSVPDMALGLCHTALHLGTSDTICIIVALLY